jgi:cation diffusion facilitator family transporter
MSARHSHDLAPFAHSHAFGDAGSPMRERALWWVTIVTLAAMVLELVVGYWSGSLALVADGWHMGTHALALGGAAFAAALSRRAQRSARFAFGGWKIEVLAAYSSGLLLLAVSVWIGIDAVASLLEPRPIAYPQAISVAVLGLGVNAACAWMLSRGAAQAHAHVRGHAHEHEHEHVHGHARATGHTQTAGHARAGEHAHAADHRHGHGNNPAQDHPRDDPHGHAHPHAPHAAPARHAHDHNFNAAYLHVLADALTSVLAIVALAAGFWWGLRWLDPVVAMVGGAVIARWAAGVLRDSARALVDASALTPLRDAVKASIESDGDARIADLHVWQVGPDAWSAVLSVVADAPLDPSVYRARLQPLKSLRHVTIEVHRCRGASPADDAATAARR